MWDPASNDPSAQQQQRQRSSDLTARPTTAVTATTADRDHLTLQTFDTKQPEINPVERVDPTADRRLVRYDVNDDSLSYQNGHPLPLNQVPIGGLSSDRVMSPSEDIMPPLPPPPLPLPSSSKKAFMIGSTALSQEASSVDSVAPNFHQHQQRHVCSYIDNTNNIPMDIDTFSRVSSTLSPDRTDCNTQLSVPAEPTPLSPPLPPQMSTPEERYTHDRRSTSSSPAPAPAPAPPRLSSSVRNTRDTSPCIAQLYIPASHMSLFQDALRSPPDPDLKVRKKTVRFNKTNSPPRSEHRHERRNADISGSYSSSSKSPSTSSPSSHAASSKSTFSSTKSTSAQPQIAEKDPEERMSELMELKQMKIRQEDLLHLKEQVFQTGQNLEEKQTILDEVRAERKMLHTELNRYIGMVKQVQKDLELASQAETQLTKERDQLSQYLTQLRDHDFNVLKEEVDQLRSKKGLRPLPSLEQEQEEFTGRYLEERRGQWREDGAVQDSSSSYSSHLPSLSLVAAATTRNRHGAGSSSSSSTAAAVVASSSRSSRTPSSSSTTGPSTFRGRDRDNTESSRSNRTDQSSSSSAYSRSHSNNSASSKSKPESSSRHNSRSSRRQSSRSRSSSPPVHSSSSSREERSKKRSRY